MSISEAQMAGFTAELSAINLPTVMKLLRHFFAFYLLAFAPSLVFAQPPVPKSLPKPIEKLAEKAEDYSQEGYVGESFALFTALKMTALVPANSTPGSLCRICCCCDLLLLRSVRPCATRRWHN